MNRLIFFARLFWKLATFCFKLALKSMFLLLLFPIKLAHHSVKTGVEAAFKDTTLNSRQIETIEKIFEYLAYVAWGQNLLPDTILNTWYTGLSASYPVINPYIGYITCILGIFMWLIAFNLKKER